MNKAIEIAIAGLNRFYDEGFTRWPEDKLIPLFSNRNLDDFDILNALSRWEGQGWVRIEKSSSCYLEVLSIIPD
jgi:hypothetical protein